MPAQNTRSGDSYQSARKAFDALDIEDRALFLLEATVTTIGRGIEEAGRALSRVLEDLVAGPGEPPPEDAEPAPEAGKKTTRKSSSNKSASRTGSSSKKKKS